MEVQLFESIEVYDGYPNDGGVVIRPSELGIDVEYVEQEKTGPAYAQNLFSELWETGKYGSNSFEELVSRCYAVGVAYDGKRYYIGPCLDLGVELH